MAEFTEEDRRRIDEIYKHMLVLNKEQGEICGRLAWIERIILGTFFVACTNLILGLF